MYNIDKIKRLKNILHLCESHTVLQDLEYYGIHDVAYLQHGVYKCFYEPVKDDVKESHVFYGLKQDNRDYVENNIIPIIKTLRPDIIFDTIHPGDLFRNKHGLRDMYDKCKVYIDFTAFTGREMMPREAALRDCILILSDMNVAGTYFDYPVPQKYKMDITDPYKICKCIIDCIDNYKDRISDFKFFKNKCMFEPEMFKAELYSIFGPAIKKPFNTNND